MNEWFILSSTIGRQTSKTTITWNNYSGGCNQGSNQNHWRRREYTQTERKPRILYPEVKEKIDLIAYISDLSDGILTPFMISLWLSDSPRMMENPMKICHVGFLSFSIEAS